MLCRLSLLPLLNVLKKKITATAAKGVKGFSSLLITAAAAKGVKGFSVGEAACLFLAAQNQNNHRETTLIKSLFGLVALASYWLGLPF